MKNNFKNLPGWLWVFLLQTVVTIILGTYGIATQGYKLSGYLQNSSKIAIISFVISNSFSILIGLVIIYKLIIKKAENFKLFILLLAILFAAKTFIAIGEYLGLLIVLGNDRPVNYGAMIGPVFYQFFWFSIWSGYFNNSLKAKEYFESQYV